MVEFTIATSKERLTEAEALDSDLDMIPALSSQHQTDEFRQQLDLGRSQIEKIISRHLGIPQSDFVLSQSSEWIWGGFNVCLPIHINSAHKFKLPRRALIRFAVPFRVGEDFSPGSVDEKLRCEAATYLWLRQNCPMVPIPRLLGMGFPGTQSFTAIENESTWNWLIWLLRRSSAWLCGYTLPPYFAHRRDGLPDLGYLLIEFVEDGQMLSSTWQEHRHDVHRRSNLYRSLARIMLSLTSVPLPRIGSWTMDDRGVVSLTNRPVSDLTIMWNRHRIPTDVPRDQTYTSVECFGHDMLTYQDNRLRHQPNSIISKDDGIYQLSALTAFRALLPRFWRWRDAPFVVNLTDLHQSNVFVDEDWNITRVIDLEFAPVRPLQMARVPSWLNSRSIDELTDTHLEEYQALYDEFVKVVEQEENHFGQQDHTLSRKFREDWDTGRLWYTRALDSLNGFPAVFEQHLRPRFFQQEFQLDRDGVALMRLWDEDVMEIVEKKLVDLEVYEERIREIFAVARAREMQTTSALSISEDDVSK